MGINRFQLQTKNDLDLGEWFTGVRFPAPMRLGLYRTPAPTLRPLHTAVAMTSRPPLTVPRTPRMCAPTENESSGWTRARGQADNSTASSGPPQAPSSRDPVVAKLAATPLIQA